MLLVVGAILAGSIIVALGAARVGVPSLVAFLALGMLLGSDGPGGIEFDDAELARTVGVVGLAAILFEGGLSTSWRRLRRVAVPATLLATVGVVASDGSHRGRGVLPLRPVVARVGAAGGRCGLDGRGSGVRNAQVHTHPATAGANARGGDRPQRPRGDRAHDRPHRLDRGAGLRVSGPRRLHRRAARDRPRDRGRPGRRGAVDLRAAPALDRIVRARGIGGRRSAVVRSGRRRRRQRLPCGVPRRPRGRQHPVTAPPPAGRLPRGTRVPRPGDDVRRAGPARLSEGPAGGCAGRARARWCC